MKLMTKEIEKKLPKLYATKDIPAEEKVAVAKFFTPWAGWTWYVVEGEKQPDGDWLFFGLVEGIEDEWGYFTLRELEEVVGIGGLRIERDIFFGPKKMKEVRVQT